MVILEDLFSYRKIDYIREQAKNGIYLSFHAVSSVQLSNKGIRKKGLALHHLTFSAQIALYSKEEKKGISEIQVNDDQR